MPGLSSTPVAANAAPPWRTIHGTVASVWTLLTTVGLPNRPVSVGYGGFCSGWPRLPSSALSRTVSSPSMNAPWTGRIVTVTRWPLLSTLSPRKPASSAASAAPSSFVTSAGSSARTARIASVAPTANAAIARPSSTRYGSAASSAASVCEPGSAP